MKERVALTVEELGPPLVNVALYLGTNEAGLRLRALGKRFLMGVHVFTLPPYKLFSFTLHINSDSNLGAGIRHSSRLADWIALEFLCVVYS